MAWDDLWGALASLGGAWITSSAAGKAADVQAQAAGQAAGTSQAMYEQGREDIGPWRDVGANALYQMAALQGTEYEGAPGTMGERYGTAMSRFKTSPGYEFRLSEGLKALDRSAASRGRLMSGATIKGAQEYGQGVASQEYGQYYNRLASMAGLGQTSAAQGAAAGSAAAGQIGGAQMYAGAARASGYGAQANAWSNAGNQLAYLYGRGA
ncbi:hypothetical protein LCGC14_0355160 [marine sediment metagenome]|uniref:Uncharacterized protein n=1 Tax=marine sediment metagenome TaxID=412755 RepID=A0A0F9VWW6_9ZZZZ